MTPRLLLFASLAALGACAHGGAADLPTCDGKDRRPANPHGSILAPASSPSTPAPGGSTGAPQGGCT